MSKLASRMQGASDGDTILYTRNGTDYLNRTCVQAPFYRELKVRSIDEIGEVLQFEDVSYHRLSSWTGENFSYFSSRQTLTQEQYDLPVKECGLLRGLCGVSSG